MDYAPVSPEPTGYEDITLVPPLTHDRTAIPPSSGGFGFRQIRRPASSIFFPRPARQGAFFHLRRVALCRIATPA